MSFAEPAYLGLLGLVPFVVFLHMRRHRAVSVPSTLIWRLVAERSEPRPRLKPVQNTLSLWLQIASVVLGALALAEPKLGAPQPTHHVLLLDASATAGTSSQEGGMTAYERAWREWLANRSSAGRGSLFSVWWVGPWTRPLALELGSVEAVERALSRSSHADAPADWGAAAEALAAHDLGDALVTAVATEPSVAAGALSRLDLGELEVLALRDQRPRLGLESVTVERVDAEAGTWAVTATAALDEYASPRPPRITFRVTFLPDGMTVPLPFAEREVAPNLGGRARFSQELTLPGPGVLQVSAADPTTSGVVSAWYKLSPRPAALRAHVVSPLGSESPSARILSATDRFQVTVSDSLPASADADLVVVEASPDQFGERVDAASAVLWLGSFPGAGADDLDGSRLAQVTRWDAEHPVTSGTSWPATSGLEAARVDVQGEVLVEGIEGPLVTARTTRVRREVIAAYDPRDPRFSESDEFVTFMVDAIDWLAPAVHPVMACVVGQPCRVPWQAVTSGFEASLDEATTWRQPPPVGAVVPSRLDEAWVPTRAGLWRLTTGDGGTLTVPVNAVPMAAPQSDAEADAVPPERPSALRRSWPRTYSLLLLLAGLVLAAEGLLAARRPGSFLRRSALSAPGTTGLRSRRTAVLFAAALAAVTAAVAAAPILLPRAANWLVVVGEDAGTLPAALGIRSEGRVSEVKIKDDLGAIDLQRALEEAAARVDPSMALDVLFVTAPQATKGNALYGIGPLLSRGAAVHMLTGAARERGLDVVAADLHLPRLAFSGDAVEVTALVFATAEVPAQVRMLLDGVPAAEWSEVLGEGWTSFRTTVELVEAGRRTLSLQVSASEDEHPENDEYTAVFTVRTGPSATVYASDLEAGRAFASALELHGFQVSVLGAHAVGSQPEAFAGNDLVVLMDVAAIDLARGQQVALESWVRDHGGGLAILGGERSFGPGGYLETPLDALSPLSSRVARDAPAVAMLFILDRSGSMQQVVDGRTRLDIARQATLAANELLGEGSQTAVIVFDEQAHVLLPFTDSSDDVVIASALAPLVPGGGTAIYPALVLAAEVLASTDAAAKHVVVMTDGLSQPGDFESAVARLVELDATVSAIAVGAGADVERVRSIARIGNGTAHSTTDFSALPSILAQEAMLLAGDPVVRETVLPVRTAAGESFVAGVPADLPPLEGFVETTPKAAASVLIEDDRGRPVLGAWRYGAGRVLAFTSHGVGPWTSSWTEADGFADWWSGWLRWVVQPGRATGIEVDVETVNDEVRVDVLATDDTGRPLERLQLSAMAYQIGGEGLAIGPVRLWEVAPGQYRGRFPARDGVWEVQVRDLAEGSELTESAGFTRSYATSAGVQRPDDSVITGLVGLTGGSYLQPDSGWSPPRQVTWTLARAWRPWFLVAIALWLAFLVQRYAPDLFGLGRLRSRAARARPSRAS